MPKLNEGEQTTIIRNLLMALKSFVALECSSKGTWTGSSVGFREKTWKIIHEQAQLVIAKTEDYIKK